MNIFQEDTHMAGDSLQAVDKVEILTLQDNYIEMTAMDGNAIVSRAATLKDGEIRNSILAEHGFSALVKTTADGRPRTLLFDFGFSEEGAAHNAQILGVDMTGVEAVALSHGHSDHTGGMKKLAALIGKQNIPFIVHPAAFKSPRYLKWSEKLNVYFPKLTREMILSAGFSLVESEKPYPLLNNTALFLGEIPRSTDFEKGFSIAHTLEDGREAPDAIEDDTSIVVNLKERGLVVLSGCAHAGIVNTVRHAMAVTGISRVHVVMGGFHLSGPHFEPIIERTARELQSLHPDYVVPTHCTGRKAIMAMEKLMPELFILNMAGTRLTFAS
jgi:7,8-dihydropterin-6-yl-methyl-4-(beta-D-ribofuranosyl)aminobenzene 5'-phosphate synthase